MSEDLNLRKKIELIFQKKLLSVEKLWFKIF